MIIKNIIQDTLIRIKNNSINNKKTVKILKTKKIIQFLNILYNEGYISGYKYIKNDPKFIDIMLKYINDTPVIKQIDFFSKSKKNIYCSLSVLSKIDTTNQLLILSTPKGYLTSIDALKRNTGGKILCLIR